MRAGRRERAAGRAVTARGGLGLGAVALALLGGLAASVPARAEPPRLGAARNFVLTTQQNDRLWLTQLRGRLVVLTFTCTTCDACPGLLPGLEALARTLGDAAGRRVFFVAVTVDPRRDTAPVLRRFARERGLDLRAWLLLTGNPSEVDLVAGWHGVDVRREDGRVGHGCLAVLIDEAGVIRGRYTPGDLGRLGTDVEALLRESAGS